MLYSVQRQSYIPDDYVPHAADFDQWRARLSPHDFQRVYDHIAARVAGEEVITSSWLPGSDWRKTEYECLWSTACLHNETHAGFFFGLILWVVMRDDDQSVWGFDRYDDAWGNPIAGMTYFKLRNPPPRS